MGKKKKQPNKKQERVGSRKTRITLILQAGEAAAGEMWDTCMTSLSYSVSSEN